MHLLNSFFFNDLILDSPWSWKMAFAWSLWSPGGLILLPPSSSTQLILQIMTCSCRLNRVPAELSPAEIQLHLAPNIYQYNVLKKKEKMWKSWNNYNPLCYTQIYYRIYSGILIRKYVLNLSSIFFRKKNWPKNLRLLAAGRIRFLVSLRSYPT